MRTLTRFLLYSAAVLTLSYVSAQSCNAREEQFQQFVDDFCPKAPPRTCQDVTASTPRAIAVLESGLEVLCDTETDGGGWLVIQRRANAEVDFYRNWVDYKYGFGDLEGNFWFGNEKISKLTNLRRYELRIDIVYNDTDYYAAYNRFRLHGEDDNYRIQLSGYSGNAGDDLSHHNNEQFSTKDRDHDSHNSHCAVSYKGAWWYGSCHRSNLNGLWGNTQYAKGLTWLSTTGYYNSSTFSEMKIRPVPVTK